MKVALTDHRRTAAQSKLSDEGAKSRSAGNNRVRLEAARRTIEELEGRPVEGGEN